MQNNDYILRSDAMKAILGVSIYDSIEELDGARTIAENTWADGLYDAYKIIEEEVDAADVEPKRKWIPVTERLPEVEERFTDCESFAEDKDGEYYPIGVYTCWESEPVLICACLDGMKERYTARYEEWRFADGRPNECRWLDVSGDVELSYVTHWMPLPEPPKEDGDAKGH